MSVLNSDFLIHMQENFVRMKDLFRKKKGTIKSEIEMNIEDGINLSNNMITKIDGKLKNTEKPANDYFRLLGMKATLLYEQSRQYVCIGQQDKGKEILVKSYTELKGEILRPELGYVILRMLNHLSFYVHLNDPTRAQHYLEESELYYYRMVQTNASFSWYTSTELFSPLIDISFHYSTKEKFEKLFINNMQLLSCIYFKENNMNKYVLYQHDVLSKQLALADTDPSQWASKVARLAMVLLQLEMYKEARHHLSAATCVIEAHSVNLATCLPSPGINSKETEMQRSLAEISRCWCKYGIKLLTASKYHLFRQKFGEPNDFLNSLWTTPKEIVDIVKCSQERMKTEQKSTETIGTLEDAEVCDYESAENIGKAELRKSKSAETLKCDGQISLNSEGNDVDTEAKEGCNELDEHIKESIEVMKESIDYLNTVRSNTVIDDDSKINNEECLPIGQNSVEEETRTKFETPEMENNTARESFTLPEKNIIFHIIETSPFEKKVTCDYIKTAPEAHDLFLFSHFWVKKSKDFYRFHIYAEEYINAVLDLSELYRLTAFFDDDIEVQYKLQKRRSDTLEALHVLIKELNPDIYLNISIDLLRELAEVQVEMIRLNMRRMDTMGHDMDGMFQKLGAMSDIHSRLNHYRDSLGHSVLFGSMRDRDIPFVDKLP